VEKAAKIRWLYGEGTCRREKENGGKGKKGWSL